MLSVFGYPAASKGALQGTTGDTEKKDGGDEYWTYEDINTYPGMAGCAIFKKVNKVKMGIYGIHIYCDIAKQINMGIFLNDDKVKWIEMVSNKFKKRCYAVWFILFFIIFL